MWKNRMYTCMCDQVTLLYGRKLTEHCKPAMTKKKKIIFKKTQKENVVIILFLVIPWLNYLQISVTHKNKHLFPRLRCMATQSFMWLWLGLLHASSSFWDPGWRSSPHLGHLKEKEKSKRAYGNAQWFVKLLRATGTHHIHSASWPTRQQRDAEL